MSKIPSKMQKQKNNGKTSGIKKNNKPTEEQIRARAYELYSSRGSMPGNDMDDWLEAERELRA